MLIEQLVEEASALGGIVLLQGAVQLAQQFLLLSGELGGGLHHHGEAEAAPAAGVAYLRNALVPDDEFLAGLGALGDV